MATGYTPGLKVAARTRHRARRLLPVAGEVLVKVGDHVDARQIVARTFMPGDVTPLNLAKLLSMAPAEVPACMLKKEGERIERGEVLARTKGIFGRFRTEYTATMGGTIETVSAVTGQVLVRGEPQPLQVLAYLAGTVVEIVPHEGCAIESLVTLVQGIFGIGGEAFGPITMACTSHDQALTADRVQPTMKGAVIVGGSRVTREAIDTARSLGVTAIIAGGIDDDDLKAVLGYDLGVAVTGFETIGLTLVITEGFGDVAMAARTFNLLRSREGEDAAVNGATQIRAGVLRPEIVIPLEGGGADGGASDEGRETPQLAVGAPVRIIRDPYFGLIGSVGALPPDPRVLESGSKARVLEVRLDCGESVIIPRANVELIEE
jgi:hypothetical protein